MSKIIFLMIAAAPLLLGTVTFGDSKKKKMSFDELLVKGKRHQAIESTVTVENDKVLDALLKVRPDFKDRIRQSSNRK